MFAYGLYAFRKGYCRKIFASLKGIIFDGGKTLRKGYPCESVTVGKSALPYRLHAIWNYGILASDNKDISCCLYDGITIVTAIVYGIFRINFNGLNIRTLNQCQFANASDILRDINSLKRFETLEGMRTNACDIFRYGD